MKTCRLTIMVSNSLLLCVVPAAVLNVHAGPTVFPPGGESACEADWVTRQPFDSLPALSILKFVERDAERGVLAAQLRLGMVYKTLDGKWTTSDDYSYNIHWLEKAVQQGSKTAGSQLATIQYTLLKPRAIDHQTYIKALIPAALDERNPWVATTLMDLTRRRAREPVDSRACMRFFKPEECNGLDLLPKSDTRKWAEIAAEGGNAAAQEWLCLAAEDPHSSRAEFGQSHDDKAAFKWCYLAAHNACNFVSAGRLAILYRDGRGTLRNSSEAQRWADSGNQPWRSDGRLFFQSPK